MRNIQEKLSLTYFFYIKVDSFWIYCCLHSFFGKITKWYHFINFYVKSSLFHHKYKDNSASKVNCKTSFPAAKRVFPRHFHHWGGLCAHTRKKNVFSRSEWGFPAAKWVLLQWNEFPCGAASFPAANPVSLQRTQFPCCETSFPADVQINVIIISWR